MPTAVPSPRMTLTGQSEDLQSIIKDATDEHQKKNKRCRSMWKCSYCCLRQSSYRRRRYSVFRHGLLSGLLIGMSALTTIYHPKCSHSSITVSACIPRPRSIKPTPDRREKRVRRCPEKGPGTGNRLMLAGVHSNEPKWRQPGRGEADARRSVFPSTFQLVSNGGVEEMRGETLRVVLASFPQGPVI